MPGWRGTRRRAKRIRRDPPTDATVFFEAAGVGLDAAGFGAAKLGERLERGARCATVGRRSVAVHPDAPGRGDRQLRTAAPSVTICNGPYFGLGFAVAPDADPADGLLDLVVFSGMSRLDVVRHYLRVARGRPRREPRMRYLTAPAMRVDSVAVAGPW